MSANGQDLLDALGAGAPGTVAIIGGGGKTTLMLTLARALAASGRTCITTTSTRILEPGPGETSCVLVGPVDDVIQRASDALLRCGHVTVAQERDGTSGRVKLLGFALPCLDRLAQAGVSHSLIVEADGSAGRSLKGHDEHEPAVPRSSGLVIVVIGVDGVGAPLDAAHVHRPALFALRCGLDLGAPVGPDAIADVLLHPEGPLRVVPDTARVVVAVTKFSEATSAQARALAASLRARDRDRRLGAIVAMGPPDGAAAALLLA